MGKKRHDKRREQEILHNYLEFLALNYKRIEPAEMTDSICKVYQALNPIFEAFVLYSLFGFCTAIITRRFFKNRVDLMILLKKFFGR